jgi:hypothetical protein
MKKLTILLSTSALLFSAAVARPDALSDQRFKFACDEIAKGEHQMDRTRRFNTDAPKLMALDVSIRAFRSARKTAIAEGFASLRKDAETDLVRALDSAAEIYLRRGSLRKAESLVVEALLIDQNDARARNLAVMIEAKYDEDIVTEQPGTQAAQRVGDRRAATRVRLGGPGLAGRR